MPLRESTHDGAYGTWVTTDWTPEPAHLLHGLVDRVWFFDGRAADRHERVFPNGTLDLIVHLDHRYRPAGSTEPYPQVSIGGLLVAPLVIEAPPERCRVLGIQLPPAGGYAIVAQPIHTLTGITVDLRAVIGRETRMLVERCEDTRSSHDCIRVAVDWLTQRVRRAPELAPWIVNAIGHINRYAGDVRVRELQRDSGLSQSRFATAFRSSVGVTPKQFARIVRFRRSMELIHEGATSLSDIAFVTGYFDQAHMNAEYRHLAHMSPGAFQAARRFPQTASLAESG